jgi:hypothetical protein
LSYTRGLCHCKWLVGLVGLEPTTSCSQSTRATKLRHSPILGKATCAPFSVLVDSYFRAMELETGLLERVRTYRSLSRWERREVGRDLRRLGLSYGEIMNLIPVKKSTLATWCREVCLTEEQVDAIRRRTSENARTPDTQWKRRSQIDAIRRRARLQVERLIDDPVWVAGVVLYWGEGGKTRNDFKLANADPRALRFFVRWVRTYLDPGVRFSLQLHLHEGNDEREARRYWRAETGLDDANFYKTFIKPRGTGHRKNHLEHGVCTVVVRRCADSWQTTAAWVDEVATRLGLEPPHN